MNLVALGRLCWRLLQHPDELWAKIFQAKYGSLGNHHLTQKRIACSLIWKSILQGFQAMQAGLLFPAHPEN